MGGLDVVWDEARRPMRPFWRPRHQHDVQARKQAASKTSSDVIAYLKTIR
jgi:hypothetical protein